jgi:two-component system cell cycle sensor histidine kinase PleC
MLNNIKFFVIASFVLIIAVAYGLGLYSRNITINELIKEEQNNSEIILNGYIENVWNKHHDTLMHLTRLPPNKWRAYSEFYNFEKESKQYFASKSVDNVTLYINNGVAIISNIHLENLKSLNISPTKPYFTQAINGEISYNINDQQLNLFLPILAQNPNEIIPISNGNTEVILGISNDLSSNLIAVEKLQIIICVGIIGLFLVILILMVIFSKRAEGIISKQHEINLELTAAAASAEAENRDKSMFLANISHELRTPLNAIIGFSDILSTDLDNRLELKHKDYLRDINSSGKHLLSLINDILEYSKAEAGKLEIDLSEIDAVKMVKNTIRLIIPRADEAQVTIQEELPKQSFIMHTDAKKIKQILLNLLSNSVKFTPPNGKVKITSWHDAARNRAFFIVSDTGIGIAPKDISKVMSPFGQVDSELSRRYEGTGLGLPLSKRLVELLGGTFKIESEVGVGTTITLDLPMRLERHNAGS